MIINPECYNIFIRQCYRGDAILSFQISAKAAHGRDTAPSTRDSHYYPVTAIFLYLFPQGGIIRYVITLLEF